MGNTCSINTLVQCIGHCDRLRDWLLSDEPHKHNEEKGRVSISAELSRIIHEMWIDNMSLAPVRFVKALFMCLGDSVRYGEQLDLSELWMLLVDRINTEVGRREECPMVEGGKDIEGFRRAWNGYNERCMSSWLRCLQGWMINRIQCCACNRTANVYEPFCCLGLDVHGSTGDMERMFGTMFSSESIEERSCDFCNSRAAGKRRSSICMYPPVLVISFKRFETIQNGATRKLTDPIDIPLSIRFAGMDGSYGLCSIGNHVGSLDGGHYYAVARNPDGAWHVYDDIGIARVDDVSTITKKNRDVYMLFYELL